ncbi:DUF2339 domain-containing protein [Zophobihabitans entericus]|uniref:DUF2339 domain-containing protein n=1 Tax=Zophobihabitans entericus TaxID=1635327 RepID=A0A6G9IDL0_9GAMM|nr:DUF2339 domain-containing protein [Zophobihabitans entericus]QIQ22313.1 DUF2339 domain-containing protein [Zophobihabitans entericus]
MTLLLGILLLLVVIAAFINLQGKFNHLQQQLEELKKVVNKDLSPTSPTTVTPQAAITEKAETPPADNIPEPKTTVIETQPTPVDAKTEAIKPASTVAVFSSKPTANVVVQKQAASATNQAQVQTQQNKTDEPDLGKKLWLWFVNGNPVAKLAIIILFFGFSYLFKYSIDHQLLSPEVRILGALVLGGILLGVGWRLRKTKELYALILQGGAIGVLYLTIFAAIKLYTMIPFILAFILLVVICSCSVMLAVLQRAISLAVIACIGGYLAPVLLSSNAGNHIGLFSYYLLISSAILAISFWQSWRVLNLIGFIFTFVVAFMWGVDRYQPAFYFECQIFIIANLLIYGVIAVLTSVRSEKQEKYQHVIDLILLFSAPLIGFSLQYSIVGHIEFGPAYSALFFGLFYLVGGYLVLRKWQQDARRLAVYGLALGVGFITLTFPLAFSAQWTSLSWLIEGTVISWAALSQRQHRFAWIGAFITILGSLSLFLTNFSYNYGLDNTSFITLYITLSIIALFSACLWHHYRHLDISTFVIKVLFLIIAALSWTILIIDSTLRFTTSDYPVQIILFGFVAAVWFWYFIGRKQNWDMLQYSVIALWPILFISLFTSFVAGTYTIPAGLLGLSWIAAFGSAYFYLNQLQKNSLALTPLALQLLHISLFWILLLWIANEIRWVFSHLPWGFESLELAIVLAVLALVIFIGYILRNQFPFKQYQQAYWFAGLAPVIVCTILVLFTGLYDSGQILGLTFVPILNPLEQGAIFALMMLTVWSLRTKQLKPAAATFITVFQLVLVLFIFLWGNSIILRTLSTLMNISWSFKALWNTSEVQVVFSLTWMLIALILVVAANRYKQRYIWFSGAALQGIVVLKLILVDSIELDGLLRAFVFIGVAILMLIIGYFAPLPPRNAELTSKELTEEVK